MTKGYRPPLPEIFPKDGEVYTHYKGDKYQVIGLAIHSNDDTWMVIYKPLYENPDAKLFALPLINWNEKVTWEGKELSRFTLSRK